MQKYARVEKKKEVLRTAALILSGAVTGILSGFFGGGGGMLVVPALTLIMKLTEKQAHATAIAVILPVTVVGAVTYLLRGVSAGWFCGDCHRRCYWWSCGRDAPQ